LKKTGIIFTALSCYILLAFSWWTYSHIKNAKLIYNQQIELLETQCYKASLDVNEAIKQDMFANIDDLKVYFYANYPLLEIVFDPEMNGLENFLIRPQQASVVMFQKKYQGRIWMYALEGVVMVVLIFWGIIFIYRNLLAQVETKKQQSNFLLSVTHELKTPLSSIRLYLETLNKRKLDESQQSTIIHNAIDDVTRLNGLVENMLLATQLDNKKYEPDLRAFDLSECLYSCVNTFILPRNNMEKMDLRIEENVTIVSDKQAVTMMINNLLSNALKYALPESVIEVGLSKTPKNISLWIANDGPGISDKEKKMIFDRFYRIEDDRTRKTKGTGLGLFIVKNLAELLQAEIQVKDRLLSGVVFEIIFPIND
jgi:signal transduction histidine kinase